MKIVIPFISNTLMNFIIGLLLARFLGPPNMAAWPWHSPSAR